MAAKKELTIDPWTIVNYPNLSEKSIGMVETNNTLVFIVNEKSNKKQVKWAVEKLFNVKVESVNMNHDRKARKKAYVRLNEKENALDIATRLGML